MGPHGTPWFIGEWVILLGEISRNWNPYYHHFFTPATSSRLRPSWWSRQYRRFRMFSTTFHALTLNTFMHIKLSILSKKIWKHSGKGQIPIDSPPWLDDKSPHVVKLAGLLIWIYHHAQKRKMIFWIRFCCSIWNVGILLFVRLAHCSSLEIQLIQGLNDHQEWFITITMKNGGDMWWLRLYFTFTIQWPPKSGLHMEWPQGLWRKPNNHRVG